MGLEAVELILNFEEKLQISFDDAALERIRTVEDLTDYVQKSAAVIPFDVPAPCITSLAFFRLRAAITAVTPDKRSQFRPAAKINDVFSSAEIRRNWPRIAELSRLRLPRLVRQRRVVFLATIIVLVITALIARGLTQPFEVLPDDRFLITAGIFLLLIGPAAWLAARLTHHLKCIPESRPKTIADLIRDLVERNIGPLRRELGVPFTKEEVFAIVRRELVIALGCDADEVRPEAKLIEDLGFE